MLKQRQRAVIWAVKVAALKSRKPQWVVGVLLAVATALTGMFWFTGDNDPLFHGIPESKWIKHLKYSDDEQAKEWRAYGEEGIQVLIRGLQRANRPGERAYRRFYRSSPRFLTRWLPAPKPDSTRGTRMCLVSLLSRLGNDARNATPIMIQALNDEAAGVRQIAISFFNSSEDDNALLNQMPEKEKLALLPVFIRLMQDVDWGVRNNATVALRYYPRQREVVVPVLTNALHDSYPPVTLLAAVALNQIAPDTIPEAGVVPMVIQILQNPDAQVARRAAQLLGDMRQQPALAVAALIESLRSTNVSVACASAQALTRFAEQADMIIPALEQASLRMDNVGGWARRALTQFESAPEQQRGEPRFPSSKPRRFFSSRKVADNLTFTVPPSEILGCLAAMRGGVLRAGDQVRSGRHFTAFSGQNSAALGQSSRPQHIWFWQEKTHKEWCFPGQKKST